METQLPQSICQYLISVDMRDKTNMIDTVVSKYRNKDYYFSVRLEQSLKTRCDAMRCEISSSSA